VCGLTFPLWSYREGQTLKRDVRSRPGGAIELPEIVSSGGDSNASPT